MSLIEVYFKRMEKMQQVQSSEIDMTSARQDKCKVTFSIAIKFASTSVLSPVNICASSAKAKPVQVTVKQNRYYTCKSKCSKGGESFVIKRTTSLWVAKI